MKTKVIIPIIMVVAMVLATTIALAANFSADPLTSVSSGEWQTTDGSFATYDGGSGVISAEPTDECRAAHPVTTDPSGAFSFSSAFKVGNDGSDVHVGVSSALDSGDITVGWAHNFNKFVVVKDNSDILGFIGSDVADPAATYVGKISSTDGATFKCSIFQGGEELGSTTVNGFSPADVALYIENYGVDQGPVVYSIDYQSQAAASPSPSPSASPSPSPSAKPSGLKYDLKGIQDFYAKQPVVHMSNQSVIYNPDGTIKQVITGTQTTAPAANATKPATNATTPVVTAQPNASATATAKPANATAIPVSPTKTQSPGFEIVLATLGMFAALALITRKKK